MAVNAKRELLDTVEPQSAYTYKVYKTTTKVKLEEVRRTWLRVALPVDPAADELLGVMVAPAASEFPISHVQLVNNEGVIMFQAAPTEAGFASIKVDKEFFGVLRQCVKLHFIRASAEQHAVCVSVGDYMADVASEYEATQKRITTHDASGRAALKLSELPDCAVHLKLADGKTLHDMEVAFSGDVFVNVVCLTRRLEPQ